MRKKIRLHIWITSNNNCPLLPNVEEGDAALLQEGGDAALPSSVEEGDCCLLFLPDVGEGSTAFSQIQKKAKTMQHHLLPVLLEDEKKNSAATEKPSSSAAMAAKNFQKKKTERLRGKNYYYYYYIGQQTPCLMTLHQKIGSFKML